MFVYFLDKDKTRNTCFFNVLLSSTACLQCIIFVLQMTVSTSITHPPLHRVLHQVLAHDPLPSPSHRFAHGPKPSSLTIRTLTLIPHVTRYCTSSSRLTFLRHPPPLLPSSSPSPLPSPASFPSLLLLPSFHLPSSSRLPSPTPSRLHSLPLLASRPLPYPFSLPLPSPSPAHLPMT